MRAAKLDDIKKVTNVIRQQVITMTNKKSIKRCLNLYLIPLFSYDIVLS